MLIDADFDALCRATMKPNATTEDLNRLYKAAFALPKWNFIARGEFPNVTPYVASNAHYADGQYMIRAFTDADRLHRFAKENNLTDERGEVLILDIPIENIIGYLEQFIADGVHGIWFNSDAQSDGFFVPLKQLRPIKEHLEKMEESSGEAQKPLTIETLIVQVKDGLMLPSGFVANAAYTCNFFCRVPSDWLAGENLLEIYLEKIYRKVYGAAWRAGNSDGSRYVVLDSYTKIFAPETARTTVWSGTETTAENHFFFFVADSNGEIESVTAEEFQKQINQYFNVASPETSEYFSSLQHGTVKPETSLTPFYKAIAPLLENYKGAGDFTELFSPGNDATDMSDLVEDTTSNSHGAYLKYKSYTFRRHGTEPPVEIKTIGSNRLTNLQTGKKLIVNFTLSKELETGVTKLLFRFLGLESEVENLSQAIEPALEGCEFKVLLQTKGAPLPISLKLLED